MTVATKGEQPKHQVTRKSQKEENSRSREGVRGSSVEVQD